MKEVHVVTLCKGWRQVATHVAVYSYRVEQIGHLIDVDRLVEVEELAPSGKFGLVAVSHFLNDTSRFGKVLFLQFFIL